MPEPRNFFDVLGNMLRQGQGAMVASNDMNRKIEETNAERGYKNAQLRRQGEQDLLASRYKELMMNQILQNINQSNQLFPLQLTRAETANDIAGEDLKTKQYQNTNAYRDALMESKTKGRTSSRPVDVMGNIEGDLGRLSSGYQTAARNWGLGYTDVAPTAPTAADTNRVIQNNLNYGASALGQQGYDSTYQAALNQYPSFRAAQPVPAMASPGGQGLYGPADPYTQAALTLAANVDEYKNAKTQAEKDQIVATIAAALKGKANANSPGAVK